MLLKRLILAVPLAIGWTIYTSQTTIGNVILGYTFSVIVLFAIGTKSENFKLKNLPVQVINTVLYVFFLAYEILITGMSVARLILHPNLPIKPGMLKINTQDETENPVISAISAHGITITPGEMVVDFEETSEDGVLMIIHSLQIEQTISNLNDDQAKRLNRIKGILGYD